ncbi:hypothetical protein HA466_0147040 [Hirschfeldia incana]|nr:hypothetical protein HA466_0147040 [Hirschfeldia incana]
MAAVLSVCHREREYLCLPGDSMDDLSYCTLSSSNELHSCKSKRNHDMTVIDVLHRLEGFNDPSRKWRDDVLDLFWNQDSGGVVSEYVWTNLESSVFHQVSYNYLREDKETKLPGEVETLS